MHKLNRFKSFFIFASLLFCYNPFLSAQDSTEPSYLDISKVLFENRLDNNISSVYIDKNEDLLTSYNALLFKPGLQHTRKIPNNFVTKKIVLKFNVSNTSDSITAVYFFPGFYFRDIRLYKIKTTGINKIPSILPGIPDSSGYRLISLPAHDSATFLAELSFVKTYNNAIKARLINKHYLKAYIAELRSNYNEINIITFVFSGLMLMMIFFSIANYLQGANPEFLYYSGYALFLGAMLFIQALLSYRANSFTFFMEGYLDFIMQGTGIIFYMIFMRKFLDTRKKHPFLFKLYNAGIIFLIISLSTYTFFHYFSDNFSAENLVENFTKIALLLMIVIFLVYSSFHWKDKLLRFLFWGNFLLFIFAMTSQLAVLNSSLFSNFPRIFRSSIIYYEIGLVLELVLFLAGLNFKNRRKIILQTQERETLKAQNIMQEYEKEIAVYKAQQQERERISADMHDELGAGMTAIRLMSEIARNKMKENTPVEIYKISSSADDVLNKMNAIIWSMNIGNDTLDNLISYIRSYALEYFDNTPTECKVKVPENIPVIELTGDKRRNVFLCVKETLTNAMKHANTSYILIEITAANSLIIKITDKGKGIEIENIRQFGNGLRNIKRRMESIGGTFKIENKEGTITTIEMPL